MAGKIKIRTVSTVSFAITVVLAVLCMVFSLFGIKKYRELKNATNDYLACTQAIQSFRDASDHLTVQVRLAAGTGETGYINAYFEEVDIAKRRENAVEALGRLPESESAVKSLEEALTASNKLMETEIYSMRLIEEANHVDEADWPEELKQVVLSAEDQLLSDDEKRERAQAMVLGDEYETAKWSIITDIEDCSGELMQRIGDRQNRAGNIFMDVYRKLVINIGLFSVMMLAICFLLYYWIVRPLMSYNESILQGTIFPIYGASELQMLAKTYNRIYSENEERERLMRHQAEHDPLTGVLNRGSFDRVLQMYEKDGNQFALILVDVDCFKSVNDNYGHAVGDIILKKVASLLTAAFRNIDYVCRIGGDEFAVIMVDMSSELAYTIHDKISEVNFRLSEVRDGIPSVSLSVGVALTDRKNPGESIFKDADSALYKVKENGRNGCLVYGESI